MKDCIFYAQGRCKNGDSCKFSHSLGPSSVSPLIPSVTHLSVNSNRVHQTPSVHRNWTSSQSSTGANDGSEWRNTVRSSPATEWSAGTSLGMKDHPPQDSRASVTCKYYLWGACQYGAACAYAHPIKDGHGDENRGKTTETNDDESEDCSRNFAGALVHFTTGAQISKISLPSDFSTVRIHNLPRGSTKSVVFAMVERTGLKVTPECVRMSSPYEATSSSADVRVESPSFAKDLSAGIANCKTLAPQYRAVEIQVIPSSVPLTVAGRRISNNKVHISWYKPCTSAWLNFGTGNIAERVSEKFNKGRYKVLDQIVTAGSPEHSSSSGPSERNHVAWTVALQNIPYHATKSDLTNAVRQEYDKPRHIEMAKVHEAYDTTLIPTYIESLLDNIGPHKLDVDAQAQGKRCRATARFEEEMDARKAVQSLHDKRQIFLNNGKLMVNLVSLAKFKVPNNIYQALAGQISLQETEWKKRYLYLSIYPNSGAAQQFTILRIEGKEVKELADTSNTLEKLLAGMVLEDSGTAIWSDSLRTNGDTYHRLRRISEDPNMLLIRDKAKRLLKYFGPPQMYGQVRRLVTAIIDAESTADQMMLPKLTQDNQDCSICWTEAENPVLTSCKHLYCLDCFEELCKSGGSTGKKFNIQCQGEAGECSEIFGLPELQDRLSSAAFEDILETSFTSYIRSHPHALHYCPSPDCGFIYRTSENVVMQTCPRCLEVNCTACHQQHGVLTCAEYKDLASGGYEALEAYKREKGVKDCPKCATPMEKSEGCNHMTCGGCGAHICWVCLKVFDASEKCYAHMNRVHGGIGLDHLQGLE